MNEVTHVAEMRFCGLNEAKLATVIRLINSELLFHGYIEGQDYELMAAPVDEKISWRERPDDAPSSSQVGYMRRLYSDLLRLSGTSQDAEQARLSRELLTVVKAEMNAGPTKRRASELIGAVKDAINELSFTQKGVTVPDEFP